MKRPEFRITCCKCHKPIPTTQDVYSLDAEWQRRYPDMVGVLACHKCALGTEWTCFDRQGGFVEGHIPVSRRSGTGDIDAWSHVDSVGTHVAAVLNHPLSALQQGAEEYLRWAAAAAGTDAHVRQHLRILLHDWDGLDPAQFDDPDDVAEAVVARTASKPFVSDPSKQRGEPYTYGHGRWQVPNSTLTYTEGEGIYDKDGLRLIDTAPTVTRRIVHRLKDGRAHCNYLTITVDDETHTVPAHWADGKTFWHTQFMIPGDSIPRIRRALAAIVADQANALPETTVDDEDEIFSAQPNKSIP